MKNEHEKQLSVSKQIILSVCFCIISILIGEVMLHFNAPAYTIVCVYILGNVLVSSFTSSYWYGLISCLVSSLAFAYFVAAPIFSFRELSPYFIVATIILLIISMLISSITSKMRANERLAWHKEEVSNILYHLTRDLAGMTSVDEVIKLTLQNIADVFQTDCRLLLFTSEGKAEENFILFENGVFEEKAQTDPTRTFEEYKTRPALGYYRNAHQYEWPFYGMDKKVLGALAIPKEVAEKLNDSDLRLINTMTDAAGIVIEKLTLAQVEEKSKIEMSQERYRTNLLRSISHDLRTPLAGITGTAEVLMSMLSQDSKEYELASNIHKETNWLYNLVQNILSLTRIQDTGIRLKKEVMIVEDVVNSAVETMEFRLPQRQFVTNYPEDVLASEMDASLIKQVIINLLDNANKYSPMNQPIEITVWKEEETNQVAVSVQDYGEGLSPAALEKVFHLFYTTKPSDPKALRGFGLGLPICASIMKIHDGSITSGNREDGPSGAVFTIYLPEFNFELESEN